MRIDRLAKEALFGVAYVAGLSSLYRLVSGHRSGVISFHNVLPAGQLGSDSIYEQDISLETFERQLEFLVESSRLRDISEIRELPNEGFFLSFDDGMLNNYSVVAPVLEKYGVTAMFAVSGALVLNHVPHIWKEHLYLVFHRLRGSEVFLPDDNYRARHRVTDSSINALLTRVKQWIYVNRVKDIYAVVREFCERNGQPYARLDYRPLRFQPLTDDHLKNLSAAGHTIVSHAWTHRPLSFLSEADMVEEFTLSKHYLEDLLGKPVDILVYPYGGPVEVDASVMETARECGYAMAFSNVHWELRGPAGFHIPRFSLQGQTSRPQLHALMCGFKHFLTKRRL